MFGTVRPMGKGTEHRFDSFRLNSANEQLWRGSREIRLRPKTFEMVCYLVECPSQLVTKAALLDTIWPQVTVGDSMS